MSRGHAPVYHGHVFRALVSAPSVRASRQRPVARHAGELAGLTKRRKISASFMFSVWDTRNKTPKAATPWRRAGRRPVVLAVELALAGVVLGVTLAWPGTGAAQGLPAAYAGDIALTSTLAVGGAR